MSTDLELTTEQKSEIQKAFSIQEVEIKGYENAYEYILSQEVTIELAKDARELRLALSKERSAINRTHKIHKAYFLNGGRFVDSIKNVYIDKLRNMEDKLKNIEDFEKIALEKKQLQLQKERAKEFAKYTENIPENLGEMESDLYEVTLLGFKAKFERDLEAKIEAERIEQERFKAERLEREEVKKESERLAKERAKLEAEKEAQRKEAERLAKLESERLERERLERERIEQEKARIAQEEADKKAEAERLANAPIKEQLSTWVSTFCIEDIELQHEVKADIQAKFNGFVKWAKGQVDKI